MWDCLSILCSSFFFISHIFFNVMILMKQSCNVICPSISTFPKLTGGLKHESSYTFDISPFVLHVSRFPCLGFYYLTNSRWIELIAWGSRVLPTRFCCSVANEATTIPARSLPVHYLLAIIKPIKQDVSEISQQPNCEMSPFRAVASWGVFAGSRAGGAWSWPLAYI